MLGEMLRLVNGEYKNEKFHLNVYPTYITNI